MNSLQDSGSKMSDESTMSEEEMDRIIEQMMANPFAPTGGPGFTIGAIYEVNDEGAREHDAEVTVFEMELLCKHWAEMILEVDVMWAYYGTCGSWERRMRPYATMRLNHFAQFLGGEKVKEIVDEAFKDFDPPDEPNGWEKDAAARQRLGQLPARFKAALARVINAVIRREKGDAL
jgi:hypothetical protein